MPSDGGPDEVAGERIEAGKWVYSFTETGGTQLPATAQKNATLRSDISPASSERHKLKTQAQETEPLLNPGSVVS